MGSEKTPHNYNLATFVLVLVTFALAISLPPTCTSLSRKTTFLPFWSTLPVNTILLPRLTGLSILTYISCVIIISPKALLVKGFVMGSGTAPALKTSQQWLFFLGTFKCTGKQSVCLRSTNTDTTVTRHYPL